MNISVKYALFAEHDENWYEVKAKSEYAFWFIQSGNLEIEYKKIHYTLTAGDIFFFYPEVLYQASSCEKCSFTFIHFDAILGSNYQALHFYPFEGKYAADKVASFFPILLDCASSLRNNAFFAEEEMQGAVMLFLARLMRGQYGEKEAQESAMYKNVLARIQPVIIYISHHLADPIYIQELADIMNLSEKYFICTFKKGMGMPPATLNVFSWAMLQRDEDTYDFSKLDEIMQMVRANGFNGMFGNRARHLICKQCGCVVLPQVAQPQKFPDARAAW